jgi:signal transduction histidine kinase
MDGDGTLAEQQLLIYARELNDLHHQQREQLLVLQQLYAELQAKEQVRAQLLSELLSTQEQERKRIARDIHDGPLQDLGVLLLSTERCRRQIEAGQTGEALVSLGRLRADVQQTIGMLRALVSDLRPPLLDTSGLLGALDYLVGRVGRETDLTISFTSRLGCRLDPTVEIVVFRLVQESLTNIRKHAAAQHAWIRLYREDGELHLEVRDDGQGFAVTESMNHALATGHLGLASMFERAEAAGGRLSIDSRPSQGTVLHFILPFRPVEGDAESPAAVLNDTDADAAHA